MTINSESPRPVSTSPWAIVSLLSGIASYFVLPIVGAVVALITGYVSKNEINRSNGQITGEGMATAGLVLGWINIILGIVLVVLVILLVVGLISGFTMCGPLTQWLESLGVH